jgi:hypothetical protein
MFFGQGGVNFANMGGGMGGMGNNTQYVFRNGNVQYKVYSSGPGNSRSTFYSYGGESDDSEENNSDNGHSPFDMFEELFSMNNRRNKHSHTRQPQNNRKNHHHQNHTPQRNNNYSILSQIQSIFNMLPLIFLLFLIIAPYIYQLF